MSVLARGRRETFTNSESTERMLGIRVAGAQAGAVVVISNIQTGEFAVQSICIESRGARVAVAVEQQLYVQIPAGLRS